MTNMVGYVYIRELYARNELNVPNHGPLPSQYRRTLTLRSNMVCWTGLLGVLVKVRTAQIIQCVIFFRSWDHLNVNHWHGSV
jgi:hypothetical protein